MFNTISERGAAARQSPGKRRQVVAEMVAGQLDTVPSAKFNTINLSQQSTLPRRARKALPKKSVIFQKRRYDNRMMACACTKAGQGLSFTQMPIEKTAQTVFTPLADGTGVLLNLDTLVYYRLNRTAAVLWQEIESGTGHTLEDLAQHASEKYEVDDLRAHQSVREFVARLAEFKMIRVV
jgi:hypothetical protein